MDNFTLALSSLKTGAVGADGVMGTVLTSVGDIYEGTANFPPAEGEDIVHKDEFGNVKARLAKKGEKTIEFAIMNVDATALPRWLGGTVTGTAPKVWTEPAVPPTIIVSMEAVGRQGFKMECAQVSLSVTIDWKMSFDGIFLLRVTGALLTPIILTDPVVA